MNTQALIDVVVRRRELQGQTVAVLELAASDGAPLPAFSAGAHVDVHLPGGLVRPYSLCGDPRQRQAYRLGVLRDPASRGGSTAVHSELTEGARLRIGAPRNHFPLEPGAPYSVLVGGGIGITPMLAMAWALHATGAAFELHYCVRNPGRAAFLDELRAVPWAQRVHLHFSEFEGKHEGEGTQRLDPAAVLRAAPAGRHVYVCGPAGFMDWVAAEARGAGLDERALHRELFSAPAAAPGGDDAAFDVVAARSGKEVRVAPGQSLLAALKTVGIHVPVSCEQGVCGTCACAVLEGEPDHRDAYFTDEERSANDQIIVCCSRARSQRLVLDL
ncbi:PDR/VanB family oxidoreductase [Azohydromonas lata]|uniref:PDR/VanB family oxidoreductase n=1 Tax=Azohydromonas lata TaxID=45677 RepID=A0ABU5IBF9_9BURK|nr:PDR/VanB family oxidoreductase [Azohydromonas lata]MDZ5456308.1 PDR/VanB family oxidoreductase [Azohydromonas lata]